MKRQALEILGGPRARERLRETGLKPHDIRVVAAAAGGPKGLVLTPLDRLIFGSLLKNVPKPVHLIGASIGAWRMAAACLPNTDAAFTELSEDYVMQEYDHEPGRQPRPEEITRVFGANLDARLGARAHEILAHPTRRLHVVTSRGLGVLAKETTLRTGAGYAAAFAANAVNRRAMGALLERVVFSDPRDPLPVPLDDYRSQVVRLQQSNLARSVLASCSIPFWLRAIDDIPGAPRGAYWDGGITDYHLHLPYDRMGDGLVLYPHFQRHVVPGWLDKAWKHRHRATAALDNVVLLAPNPDWVRDVMPNGKLPDRGDFKQYGEAGIAARQRDWRKAIAESQRLADEFAEALARPTIDAKPLP